MDWQLAIERNRAALTRIVAALVSLAGLSGDRPTLPRHLHRVLLGLLRPAESAVRRLIVIAARGLAVPPRRHRPERIGGQGSRRAGAVAKLHDAQSDGMAATLARQPLTMSLTMSLPLLDPLPCWPRKRVARVGVPRISVPNVTALFPVAPRRQPMPDDPIDAARLNRRLSALSADLDDLPARAQRFARWMAARNSASAPNSRPGARTRHRRVWPLRPGRPPGHRRSRGRRPVHEIHELLDDIHGLAMWALQSPDTS